MTKEMTKKVNIRPTQTVRGVNPPIRTNVRAVTMTVSKIRQCIMERAMVDEILPDGSTIRLNLSNYNKDNGHKKVDSIPTKEEVKVENKETVKEEVSTEETAAEETVEKQHDANKKDYGSRRNRRNRNRYENKHSESTNSTEDTGAEPDAKTDESDTTDNTVVEDTNEEEETVADENKEVTADNEVSEEAATNNGELEVMDVDEVLGGAVMDNDEAVETTDAENM